MIGRKNLTDWPKKPTASGQEFNQLMTKPRDGNHGIEKVKFISSFCGKRSQAFIEIIVTNKITVQTITML